MNIQLQRIQNNVKIKAKSIIFIKQNGLTMRSCPWLDVSGCQTELGSLLPIVKPTKKMEPCYIWILHKKDATALLMEIYPPASEFFLCGKTCFSIERTNYSGRSLMLNNVQGSCKHTTVVF